MLRLPIWRIRIYLQNKCINICVTFQYINNNDLHNWWHVTSRCRHLRHLRPFFMMKFKLFQVMTNTINKKLRVCVADKWWNVISTWLSNAWKCRSLGLERQFEPGMQSPGDKSSYKTCVWSGNGCLDSCRLIYIK